MDARRFSESEADFQQALASVDVNRQGNDPRVTKILLALARLYAQVEEYEKGDAALERAQKLEEGRGSKSESLSVIYSRRGWFQINLQNSEASESSLQKALDIEAQAGDSNNRSIAIALNNVASAQASAGKLQEAESAVKRAIAINEKFAPQSVDLAENYNLLGSVLERLSESVPAEDAYRRSVQLFTLLVGPDHPRTVNAQTNLGLLVMNRGKSEEALEFAKLRASAFENNLLDLLASATEQQALSFVHSQNPFAFFGTLGQAEPLTEAVVNYKGAVTDAMFDRRTGPRGAITPEREEALNKWRVARRDLTEWTLKESAGSPPPLQTSNLPEAVTPSDPREWQAKRDQLAAELARAEASLARLSDGFTPGDARFNISVADIQVLIPPDAALLDFVRYSHYLGKVQWEDRYGAIILRFGEPAQWIPLGKAWDIEQATAAFHRTILGSDPVNNLPNVLRGLYDLVVAPLLSKLPVGTKRLLVSPDGELNFVSFGTLLTSRDRFLAEQYSITYLANARTLLKESQDTAEQASLDLRKPEIPPHNRLTHRPPKLGI